MDLSLRNAAVPVTGGSGGIGRASALSFAREGARVAITYNSREDVAKAVADEIADAGGEPYVVQLTLDDLESVDRAVTDVVEHLGGLDVLVGNAVQWGSADFDTRATRIEDYAQHDWQEVLRGNLEGNFQLIKAAAPALRRSAHGRVALLSSTLAEDGMLGSWAYSAAKAGLHGLTVSLAPDLGRDGVLVNVVLAGITLDDGHHHVIPDQALPSIAARFPAGRLPSTEDVAATITYLCSPRNAATTGEIVRVSGGRPSPA